MSNIKEEQGEVVAAKGEPALVSAPLSPGDTLRCSPTARGEKKPALSTPASICCLAYASEHNLFYSPLTPWTDGDWL